MNHIARKMTVALTAAAGLGLATYAGSLYSTAHAHAKPASKVMYLGTITVTPQDAPDGDRYAQYAPRRRYAGQEGVRHGERRDARVYDETWPRI